MKKKTKGKHHGQISIDQFNVSDDDTLNYSLYCYALNRYKEATGDKEAHLRDVVIYLEKEIRYYRKKIMSYDELREKSAEKTEYRFNAADDIIELQYERNSELLKNAKYVKMDPVDYATKANLIYQEMFVMLKGAMIVLNYLNDEERFEKWTATTKLMFNNCCDNIRKYREWWERQEVKP